MPGNGRIWTVSTIRASVCELLLMADHGLLHRTIEGPLSANQSSVSRWTTAAVGDSISPQATVPRSDTPGRRMGPG